MKKPFVMFCAVMFAVYFIASDLPGMSPSVFIPAFALGVIMLYLTQAVLVWWRSGKYLPVSYYHSCGIVMTAAAIRYVYYQDINCLFWVIPASVYVSGLVSQVLISCYNHCSISGQLCIFLNKKVPGMHCYIDRWEKRSSGALFAVIVCKSHDSISPHKITSLATDFFEDELLYSSIESSGMSVSVTYSLLFGQRRAEVSVVPSGDTPEVQSLRIDACVLKPV